MRQCTLKIYPCNMCVVIDNAKHVGGSDGIIYMGGKIQSTYQ